MVANDRCTPLSDGKTLAGTLHGNRRDQKWKIKIGSLAAKSCPNLLNV
jgi:hypothetical protein